MKKSSLAVLLVLAASAPFARATLLVRENFSGYSTSTWTPISNPAQAGTGTGETGNWQLSSATGAHAGVTNGGDLAAPANSGALADVSGQAAIFYNGPTGARASAIALATPISAVDNTIYVSFTANMGAFGSDSATPGLWLGSGTLASGWNNAANSLTNATLRLGSGTPSGGVANWGVGVNNSGFTASSVSAATTAFLVYEIIFGAAGGTDTVNLYLNPGTAIDGTDLSTLHSSLSGALIATWAGSLNDADITAMRINGPGNAANTASLDNIRIGTTYGDVAALAAVPEPATYGLFGAGALAGIAALRRRRK